MKKGTKTIEVQVPLYGLEAMYQACSALLDRAYIRLEGDPSATVKVVLRAKGGTPRAFLDQVDGEFENELLHQALRLKVSEANRKIREYIVTRALASAEGVAPAGEVRTDAPSEQAKEESVLDADLEKEIQKLLAEVEKQGGGVDPLSIGVPWEEKYGDDKGKGSPANKEAKGDAS